ncbi:MAG: FAD:protein FMN transferase [Planctomycetaceae bacterium]
MSTSAARLARARRSQRKGWRIGIESPLQQNPFAPPSARQEPLSRVLELTNSSVATSGDYRNFYEIDGVRYSHTIDPVTGRPVPHPPASVSVIHKSCMTADAWATAMMVLGREKGIAVAKANGLSVLFQELVGNGQVRETAAGDFEGSETKVKSSSDWISFVAAAVLFLLAIGGMSIGVLVKNRELKGSCGGLAAMPGSDGRSMCELCSTPREDCVNDELRRQMQSAGEQR